MNEINDFFLQLVSQVSLVEMIFKGALIGIIASAPMGPVGILCIQRALNKGRIYGLVTGAGAALSDIIYALITGYGLSFIYDFIHNRTALFWLQLVGVVLMFIFGIHTFRSNPAKSTHKVSRNKSSLVQNGVTGFFLAFSNPLLILLFLALFTPFNFMLPEQPLHAQFIGYISIFGGAMLWWLFITYAVSKLRTKFDERGVWIINRVIGTLVMIGSGIGVVLIATGIYSFH